VDSRIINCAIMNLLDTLFKKFHLSLSLTFSLSLSLSFSLGHCSFLFSAFPFRRGRAIHYIPFAGLSWSIYRKGNKENDRKHFVGTPRRAEWRTKWILSTISCGAPIVLVLPYKSIKAEAVVLPPRIIPSLCASLHKFAKCHLRSHVRRTLW